MKLAIMILLFFLIISCNEQKRYSLIVANRSSEVIDEVRVWFNEKSYQIGIVSPNTYKTISGTKIELLDEMKITWIDKNQITHNQVFKTFDSIPDDYSKGNVIFAYQGNGQFILEFHMLKNDFPKLSEMQ